MKRKTHNRIVLPGLLVVVGLICLALPFADMAIAKTVTVTLDPATTKDTYNQEDSDNRNKGIDTKLGVRGEPGKDRHLFLEFPVPAQPLPWVLTSAEIVFTVKSMDLTGDDMTIGAHRVLAPWDEGVDQNDKDLNWSQRKTDSLWVSAGGDFTGERSSVDVFDGESTVTLDVTTFIQFWSANPDSNFGLVLVDSLAQSGWPEGDEIKFYSTDEGTLSRRPVLTMTWDSLAVVPIGSDVAEIQPTFVRENIRDTLTLFIALELPGLESQIDQITMAMPTGFTDPIVINTTWNGSGRSTFDMSSANQLELYLDTPVSSDGILAITFDVDTPPVKALGGADFVPYVDDWSTFSIPDQRVPSGNANGIPGDGDTLHVDFTSDGTLVVTPDSVVIAVDSAIQFTAVIIGAMGGSTPVTPTWTVTGGLGDIDPLGNFTPKFVGSGWVIATYITLSDSARVFVTHGSVDSLAIFPVDSAVTADGSVQYRILAWDIYRNSFLPDVVTWSEPTGLGSMAPVGLFDPVTVGIGLVIGSAEGIFDSTTVTISAGALVSMNVTPASAILTADSSLQFVATGSDGDGNPVPIDPIWTVNGPMGAVDGTGLFTATKVGAGQVVAHVPPIAAESEVTVVPGIIARVVIAPSDTSITADDPVSYTAIAHDADSNVVSTTFTWSEPSGLGSIDASGIYTPGLTGNAIIVAGTGIATDTASATVTAGALATIAITPASADVTTDSSILFAAQGLDAQGNDVPISPIWSIVGAIGTITPVGLFDPTTVGAGSLIATDGAISGSAPVNVTVGAVATLAVSPTDTSVTTDETASFSAIAFDADSNPFTPTVVWTEPTGLGSIDGSGLFTPNTAGNAIVVGTAEGVSDTADVTIAAGALASIVITPPSDSITADSTIFFIAEGFDSKGNPVPISASWSVVGTIGSINGSGRFDAETVGVGQVIVAAGLFADTVRVAVSRGRVATLAIQPADTTITADDAVSYTATAWDDDGNAFVPTVVWSEPTGLGSIDGAGLFQATIVGDATVVGTAEGISESADVTITPGVLAAIVVLPSSAGLTTDSLLTFSAAGFDGDGNSVIFTPTWVVSGGIGNIDGAGLFDPTTVGSGNVIARSGVIADTSSVTVSHGAADSIAVNPAVTTLTLTDIVSYLLTAWDFDRNAYTPAGISWTEPTGLGTINGVGQFDPDTPGSGIVIGSAEGLSDTASFTVLAASLDSIRIAPSIASVTTDTLLLFTATGYFNDASSGPVSPAWSVNGGVGTIDGFGLLDATLPGVGSVVASLNGRTDTVTVSVMLGRINSLEVTPENDTITAAETILFDAVAYDADHNSIPSASFTWSEPGAIGFIDLSGLFTPASPGAGIVVGTSSGISDTVSFTVTPGALDYVVIAPASAGVTTDSTLAFAATGYDALGFEVLISPAWSVEGGIGTVDIGGLFDPTTPGNGLVIVTADGKRDTAHVTVTAGMLNSFLVLPSDTTISVDGLVAYNGFGFDADANPLSLTIIWSAPGAPGSITSGGLFTPGGTGSGMVVGSTGGFSDTATVTVTDSNAATLEIIPNTDSVTADETIDFDVIALNASGDPVPLPGTPVWSGGTGIGTIDPASGLFDATSVGMGTVSVSAGGVNVTSGIIVVTAGATASIMITPGAVLITAGNDTAFAAVPQDGDGNPTNEGVLWSVTGGIGSIGGTGLFMATTAGNGHVVASAGSVLDSAAVTVLDNSGLTVVAVLEERDLVRAGESAVPVSLVISNASGQTVTGLSGSLRFSSGATDLSGEYTVSLIVGMPDSLPDGASDTCYFVVGIDDSATTGELITIDGSVFGTLGMSGAPTGDLAADVTGSWTVTEAPLLDDVTRSLFPARSYPGKSEAFAIALRNRGGTSLTLQSGTMLFLTDGTDSLLTPLLAEVTVPAGGSAVPVYFSTASIPPTFDPGSYVLTIRITGVDGNGLDYPEPLIADNNALQILPPYILVEAIPVPSSVVLPGEDSLLLMRIELINLYEDSRTLGSVQFTNHVQGLGSTEDHDGSWGLLTLINDVDRDGNWTGADSMWATGSFTGGTMLFENIDQSIAPEETLSVLLTGSVSLFGARDGDELDVTIAGPGEIDFGDTTAVSAADTLNSPGARFVDGMVAAQIKITGGFPVSLPAGGDDSLAMVIRIPSNGYMTDTLRTISVGNLADAEPAIDIAELRLFADGGNGLFDRDGGDDQDLGPMPWIGDIWSLSRIDLPIPPGGALLYVAVDAADGATEERVLRLTLPVDGIDMASSNDGPIDQPVSCPDSRILSGANRIVVRALVFVPAAMPIPGDSLYPALHIEVSNSYADTAILEQLSVEDQSYGANPDAILKRAYLLGKDRSTVSIADRLDGAFHFSGFRIPVVPGRTCTLAVVADVGLECISDGDRLDLWIDDEQELTFARQRRVAGLWPVRTGASLEVDGHAAAQISFQQSGGGALRPGETNRTVLRLNIPSNGCLPDTLSGLRLTNRGSLTAEKIDRMSLYSGTDGETEIGELVWNGSIWGREGMNVPIDSSGSLLTVKIDLSLAADDGASLQMAVPVDGITVRSDNDGPVDKQAVSGDIYLVTDSPIFASMAASPLRVSIGQQIQVALDVQNYSPITPETVFGVAPDSMAPSSSIVELLEDPTTLADTLSPDENHEFIWRFRATEVGTIQFAGRAAGTNSSEETVQTLVALSNGITIQIPPTSLLVNAVATLPEAIARGEAHEPVFVISLAHADTTENAAPVRVDSIAFSIEDINGNALAAGAFFSGFSIERTGRVIGSINADDFDGNIVRVALNEPILVTPTGEAAFTVIASVDEAPSATRFRIVMNGTGSVFARDANSGATVGVTGIFPVRTGGTEVFDTPTGLRALVYGTLPPSLNRGSKDVRIAHFSLEAEGGGTLTSEIAIDLIKVFVEGGHFPFAAVKVVAGDIVSYDDSTWETVGDTLLLYLSPPVLVPPSQTVGFIFQGDLSEDSPLGPIRFTGYDLQARAAAGGEIVPATVESDGAIETVVVLPAESIRATGIAGIEEVDLFPGTQSHIPFGLGLSHNSPDSTAGVIVESVRIRLESDEGTTSPIRSTLSRIQIREDDIVIASIAPLRDDVDTITIPLSSPFLLVAGDSAYFEVQVDIQGNAPVGSYRLALDPGAVAAKDANNGAVVSVELAGDGEPFRSGVINVREPAAQVEVAVNLMLPAASSSGELVPGAVDLHLLVPGGDANEGSLHLRSFSLVVENSDGKKIDPSMALESAELWTSDSTSIEAILETGVVRFRFDPPTVLTSGDTLNLHGDLRFAEEIDLPSFRIALDIGDLDLVEAVPILASPAGGTNPSPFTYLAAREFEASIRNYPNPFSSINGETVVTFFSGMPGKATIRIYTALGDPVQILESDIVGGGLVRLNWDGKNGKGQSVLNGVYIASIEVTYDNGVKEHAIHKIAVLN